MNVYLCSSINIECGQVAYKYKQKKVLKVILIEQIQEYIVRLNAIFCIC